MTRRMNEIFFAVAIVAFFILIFLLGKKKLPDVLKDIFSKFGDSINTYANKYQLPPVRIAAIIFKESSGDPSAHATTSTSTGLMGIEQGALTDYNNVYASNLTLNDLYTPAVAIEVGSFYLRSLMDDFGFSLDDATRGYYAGAHNVLKDANAGLDYLNAIRQIEIS